MKSKNYSLNRKNKVRIFCTELCEVLIMVSIFSFSFLSFVGNSFALNWHDKEWKSAGCPNSGIGKWKSDGPNINNDKIMFIERDRVSIISSNKFDEQFLYKKKSLNVNGEFIELFHKSVAGEKQVYIKIRPHLIFSLEGVRDANENQFNCLIKVFQYRSPKDAKFDKYLSWSIFRLINTN